MTCPPELLTCDLSDFSKSIKYMAMQDLIVIVSTLEEEITKEQENFNKFNDTCEKSKDVQSLTQLQDKIKALMDKTQLCFDRRSDFENRNAGISGKKSADSWIVKKVAVTSPETILSLKSLHSSCNISGSLQPNNTIRKSASTASLPSKAAAANGQTATKLGKKQQSNSFRDLKTVDNKPAVATGSGLQTPWGIMRRGSDTPLSKDSPNIVFQSCKNANSASSSSLPSLSTSPSSSAANLSSSPKMDPKQSIESNKEITFTSGNSFRINLKKVPPPVEFSPSDQQETVGARKIKVITSSQSSPLTLRTEVDLPIETLTVQGNSPGLTQIPARDNDVSTNHERHQEINTLISPGKKDCLTTTEPPIITVEGQILIDGPVGESVTDGLPEEEYEDEKVEDRPSVIDWNPIKLLKELYEIKCFTENIDDVSRHYIKKEGFLEKLPPNKKKATLLKTWKKLYFQARDGFLFYYESSKCEHEIGHIRLMGGAVEDSGNQLIGIDDKRGQYLVVRCTADKEQLQWLEALNSQTVDNAKIRFVQPVLNTTPHSNKKIVIIDVGSASIRAGTLGQNPSLPQVFFPSVAAIDRKTGNVVCGFDAFHPNNRRNSKIVYPLRPSLSFNELSCKTLPSFTDLIFSKLDVNPSKCKVMLCIPHHMNVKVLEVLLDCLFKKYSVLSIQIAHQAVLALHAYSAKSGIIVDIGDRYDVIPVIDGYLMAGGLSRHPVGGTKILDSFNHHLAENRYRFIAPVEQLIARLVMEKTCFVTRNLDEEYNRASQDKDQYVRTVDLTDYDLPDGTWSEVIVDVGRFHAPEGLFETELWGLDIPYLHKMVYRAIQECPMDTRRELSRSIYLSGGTTLMAGFVDRIQYEIEKLVPPSCAVEVHAMPNRYHAAYIGACVQADSEHFDQMSMKRTSWTDDRTACIRQLTALV